jgi:hypothetical protein
MEDPVQTASELLKSLQCEILSSRDNRITISTSRGNLQSIKECWLANDPGNNLSQRLNEHLEQIIIGGNLHDNN